MFSAIFGALGANSAARKQAKAMVDVANINAESSKFKPYGLTTGFGSSAFDTENQTATYTLDPRMQALRDQYYNLGEQTLSNLQLDPDAATQDYFDRTVGLMQSGWEAQDIAQRAQGPRGRMGVGVSSEALGLGPGGGLVNREEVAKQLVRDQNLQKAAFLAQDKAQQDITNYINRASNLFNSGIDIEKLGLNSLTMGADIGNKAAISNANAARINAAGQTAAANANLAGDLSTAKLLQGIGTGLDDIFSGGNSPFYQYQTRGMFGSPSSSQWAASIGAGGE
jgi:hypothetical protein